MSKEVVQECTRAAEHMTQVKISTDSERQIFFPRAVHAAPEKCGTVSDIPVDVNRAICVLQVQIYITI